MAALRRRLQDRVEAHAGEAAGCDGRLDQQVPELGNLRPGKVGAGWLCVRARRFARLRPLARLRRALVAARDQGLSRLHRMGGRAAVVERQGRIERHLLLRHQPMAGRQPAAQASGRHLRLGGLCRFLSRAQPQRRHLQHVRAELVRHAGQDRAIRARHQGPSQPHEWRLGVGTGDAHRGRDGRQPLRSRQDLLRASAGRRILQGDVAGLVEGQGAAALGRQLGRPAAAPARQFRGLLPLGVETEMAGSARHRALDALLHRLRRRIAEEVLRLLPQGREERLGQAAARAAQRPSSGREIRHPPRGRLAAAEHASGPSSILRPTAKSWRRKRRKARRR